MEVIGTDMSESERGFHDGLKDIDRYQFEKDMENVRRKGKVFSARFDAEERWCVDNERHRSPAGNSGGWKHAAVTCRTATWRGGYFNLNKDRVLNESEVRHDM